MSEKDTRLTDESAARESGKADNAETQPSDLFIAVKDGEIDPKEVPPRRSIGTWMDQFGGEGF